MRFRTKAASDVGVRSTYAKENIPSHKEIRCSTEASQSAESSTREMARCRRHVTLIWLLASCVSILTYGFTGLLGWETATKG